MKSRDSVDTDDLLGFESLVDAAEDPPTDAIIRQTDRRVDVSDYNRFIIGCFIRSINVKHNGD